MSNTRMFLDVRKSSFTDVEQLSSVKQSTVSVASKQKIQIETSIAFDKSEIDSDAGSLAEALSSTETKSITSKDCKEGKLLINGDCNDNNTDGKLRSINREEEVKGREMEKSDESEDKELEAAEKKKASQSEFHFNLQHRVSLANLKKRR